MKKLILKTISIMFIANISYADQWVNGYWQDRNKDGVKETYVKPHWRSDSDGDPYNNWSTKGNINPYTGERGTENPLNQNRGIYRNW